MTSATAPAHTTADHPVDSLLKKYSTPLIAATAIVVCATGAMMFFHLYKGQVQAMHEWLGMGFVVAAVLHLLRHRHPLGRLMLQRQTHLLLALMLLISLAFLYPSSGERKGNPMRATINAVLHAPVKDLAPVVGVTSVELAARLADAGVAPVAATDSIASLARASRTEPMKLLNAALTARKVEDDQD
ncbi:MAG: DUF4405 domain-containing protein [Propionivibrio sp.]